MICIVRTETDPFLNLAAEEYFLRNFHSDCFMLWQNSPSVIIGKHQNALAEINFGFVNQNNIPVVRRISGGGAVFHDLGNVNFTFIAHGEPGRLVDFRKFTRPIIEVLEKLDIKTNFEGRSNLTVNGNKISGNAEHVYKNKVIHHGTLLFSTNLEVLSMALGADEAKWSGNAVKSLRSHVVNISDCLTAPISVQNFIDNIMCHIFEKYPNARPYSLSEYDRQNISTLATDKYSTWEWNFGYSPPYCFNNTIQASGKSVCYSFNVVNGIITHIKISGDLFENSEKAKIEDSLIGIRHYPDPLMKAIETLWLELQVDKMTYHKFVAGMF